MYPKSVLQHRNQLLVILLQNKINKILHTSFEINLFSILIIFIKPVF